MMTDMEIINVVAAHQEGKAIQYKDSYSGEWIIAISPSWNFADSDYRIKPKQREWWMISHLRDLTPCASCGLFTSHENAKHVKISDQQTLTGIVHVREVL